MNQKKQRTNDKGLNMLKHFESCHLFPYPDIGGVATIAWGCTHYEDGTRVTLNDPPISQARADELLMNKLAEFEKGVAELVKVPVSDNQFSALVSFAFNVGLGSLKKSDLLKHLNNWDYLNAARGFMNWISVNGQPVRGLLRRRLAEATLFIE